MNLRAGEAGIHLHLRKIFAPPGASLSAAIVVSASIACPRARNGIPADQGAIAVSTSIACPHVRMGVTPDQETMWTCD